VCLCDRSVISISESHGYHSQVIIILFLGGPCKIPYDSGLSCNVAKLIDMLNLLFDKEP
jgi:hypothetical protein